MTFKAYTDIYMQYIGHFGDLFWKIRYIVQTIQESYLFVRSLRRDSYAMLPVLVSRLIALERTDIT